MFVYYLEFDNSIEFQESNLGSDEYSDCDNDYLVREDKERQRREQRKRDQNYKKNETVCVRENRNG